MTIGTSAMIEIIIVPKKTEIDSELRKKILALVGYFPRSSAVVVRKSKGGQLSQYRKPCPLNAYDANGRIINIRCVGAFAGNNTIEVYVVCWDLESKNFVVMEYTGKDLFPESTSVN